MKEMMRRLARRGLLALLAWGLAPGGMRAWAEPARALAPIPPATLALMAAKDTSPAAPLVIRTFKKEAELEIWKQDRAGRFVYIKTFPICRWSGQLGPKMYPGDRQTPEGFYEVGPRQMNPNSHYYLSFDVGFPNAYDRAHGASGSSVMVHGTCSSMGCFAMTDKQVGEIYAIAREALKGETPSVQLQAFPFHMTARNMALYRNDRYIDFWRQLKDGSDRFEATGERLSVNVASGRYAFDRSRDPERERAAAAFHARELARIAALVEDGSAAIGTVYADGGQNAIFAALARHGADLGTVSRPEALAYAGVNVTLMPGRRRPEKPARLSIDVASWRPDHAPLRAVLVKARAVDVPAFVDIDLRDHANMATVARAAPLSLVIAGATPPLVATLTRADLSIRLTH